MSACLRKQGRRHWALCGCDLVRAATATWAAFSAGPEKTRSSLAQQGARWRTRKQRARWPPRRPCCWRRLQGLPRRRRGARGGGVSVLSDAAAAHRGERGLAGAASPPAGAAACWRLPTGESAAPGGKAQPPAGLKAQPPLTAEAAPAEDAVQRRALPWPPSLHPRTSAPSRQAIDAAPRRQASGGGCGAVQAPRRTPRRSCREVRASAAEARREEWPGRPGGASASPSQRGRRAHLLDASRPGTRCLESSPAFQSCLVRAHQGRPVAPPTAVGWGEELLDRAVRHRPHGPGRSYIGRTGDVAAAGATYWAMPHRPRHGAAPSL